MVGYGALASGSLFGTGFANAHPAESSLGDSPDRESNFPPETTLSLWQAAIMKTSRTVRRRASRARREFLRDALAGLRTSPKQLPCKYFYDRRGSELFDRICVLDEYYLTRCELAIMEQFAPEMGEQIGPGAMLVEYGSGSSVKTRYLLDSLPDCVAYVPVDISGEYLEQTAAELARDYPRLEVLPVCADFTQEFDLPVSTRASTHAAVYFPGSTIGNFLPARAASLLRRIARMCGTGGGLLIGIDLKKDAATIEAAYNDRLGVTARVQSQLAAPDEPRARRRFRPRAVFAPGELQPRARARGNVPGQPGRPER